MKIHELENLKVSDLSKKQYVPVNNSETKKRRISYKLIFFIVCFAIIIFFSVAIIKRENNNNLRTILSRKSTDDSINEKNFLTRLKLVLDDDEVFLNEIMRKHTTFKLGGPAKFFIKPKTISEFSFKEKIK